MRFLAAVAATLASTLASASSTTTDFSDLWYNPNEPGWGVNIIQQRATLFVTMFVYGANGQPTWYVASDARLTSTSDGVLTFRGTLYRTSGPYFGASTFDPSQVAVTPVGAFAFASNTISSGAISYVIDNLQVTKNVQRQTWASETIAGSYIGASSGTWSGCAAARNGYVEAPATYMISQDGATVQLRENGSSYTCSYIASYSQAGRFGSLAGSGTCSDGITQTFNASEVTAGVETITMRAAFSQANNCSFIGRIAGARRIP